MDTSPEYIKMCEKAEEIQGQWSASESHDGDWIFYHRSLGNGTEEICVDIGAGSSADKWLPRQDQLQEMADRGFRAFICGMYDTFTSDYFSKFTSMEQLSLAFVMKEQYGKIWNGKEWIKE